MRWIIRSLLFVLLALSAADAWAVIGRPLTPISVAGVARRSARRQGAYGVYNGAAIAATGVAVGATVATLPAGCSQAGTVYHCGAHAYRPVYDGPDVVYVVEQ